MFTYRLHSLEGEDLREATYPRMIKVGDELFFGSNRLYRFFGGKQLYRVVDVAPFEEANELRFVGMLKVEST